MGLIKKPNELTVKTTLSALIYGQPGMGKTTLALSAPNPVLFDYDGGIHRVNAAHRVPTVQITSWEETNEVLSSEELFSKLFNHCILLYINYLIRQNNHSIQ